MSCAQPSRRAARLENHLLDWRLSLRVRSPPARPPRPPKSSGPSVASLATRRRRRRATRSARSGGDSWLSGAEATDLPGPRHWRRLSPAEFGSRNAGFAVTNPKISGFSVRILHPPNSTCESHSLRVLSNDSYTPRKSGTNPGAAAVGPRISSRPRGGRGSCSDRNGSSTAFASYLSYSYPHARSYLSRLLPISNE